MRETEDLFPAPLPLGIVPSPPVPGLWLQFQPVVWLESQEQEPYFLEALLRLGAHAPAQALARYRERGELHRLTLAVLEGALAEGARRGRAVSVNLSPAQLGHPRLRADLRALLRAAGAGEGALVVEVTEEALAPGGRPLERTLAGLRELGVRVYLDDFGSGHSSLERLAWLPLDGVKLPRGFLRPPAAAQHRVAAVLRGLVRMMEELGLPLVAEGIERPEQAAFVRELGVRLGQGFLFGASPEAPGTAP